MKSYHKLIVCGSLILLYLEFKDQDVPPYVATGRELSWSFALQEDNMDRIKITNKLPLGYQRTAGGLFDLVNKMRQIGIPREASVDWRGYNLAEFTWSAYEDLQPDECNDL